MNTFAVLMNLVGATLILAIVWWFWLYRSSKYAVSSADGIIDIKVIDGTYKPDMIRAKRGQELRLRFIRKDQTPCSETVLFADFDKSAELPVNKPTELVFTPQKVGHFDFTCQMGMYRGILIVED